MRSTLSLRTRVDCADRSANVSRFRVTAAFLGTGRDEDPKVAWRIAASDRPGDRAIEDIDDQVRAAGEAGVAVAALDAFVLRTPGESLVTLARGAAAVRARFAALDPASGEAAAAALVGPGHAALRRLAAESCDMIAGLVAVRAMQVHSSIAQPGRLALALLVEIERVVQAGDPLAVAWRGNRPEGALPCGHVVGLIPAIDPRSPPPAPQADFVVADALVA